MTADNSRRKADPGNARHGTAFEAVDVDLIRRADTFFLGTAHPERGTDASHRGGFLPVHEAAYRPYPRNPELTG